MNEPDLGAFWRQNKQRLGEALGSGIEAVADILQAGADEFGFEQSVVGEEILWSTENQSPRIVFCRVADPWDLDNILGVYTRAAERQPSLTGVFVHQGTVAKGTWDVFTIGPQYAMSYADRVRGSYSGPEGTGSALREDLWTLFSCEQEFPAPGRNAWAELLTGSFETISEAFHTLAAKYGCVQTVDEHNAILWSNLNGRLEAMFLILPEPASIDMAIQIYEKIKRTDCPLSFVFTRSVIAGTYDIFRLSTNSYLDHHNQVREYPDRKPVPDGITGAPIQSLAGLRYAGFWTSHVGCIKGCIDYLGLKVSDAWLFGATGHAFLLNICPHLCPSGPTDWNTDSFLKLGCNIGYTIEGVDIYCPNPARDLAEAQQRAWDHVRKAIDQDLPCYGWEVDIPEYYVINGYDDVGYYISGPGCREGKGPVPWENLGRSEIGVVSVFSVKPVEPADDIKTVHDALVYVLDHARNYKNWTDAKGGLAAFDGWIQATERGTAMTFGMAYNAAVWSECRRFAVEFLKEARTRLDSEYSLLFEEAVGHFEIVAQNLNQVCMLYPCPPQIEAECIPLDDRSRLAAEALRKARKAEASGYDILGRLVKVLSIER